MDPSPAPSYPPPTLAAWDDDFPRSSSTGLFVIGAARIAFNGRRWWKNSGMLINVAFPIRYFDQLGIPRLAS